MKKFETPRICVEEMEIADVISTSNVDCVTFSCANDTGCEFD
jgi:hypothetical protein